MLAMHKRFKHSHKKISGWTEIIENIPDIELLKTKINNIDYEYN